MEEERKITHILIQGKYAKDVKVYAGNVEEAALARIHAIAAHPAFDGAKIRIMPDVHDGKGIVIGFTCPMGKSVNPSHIGVDIGCTVSAVFYDKMVERGEQIALLEHRIKKEIPTSRDLHEASKADMKDFIRFMNNMRNKACTASNGLIQYEEWRGEQDVEKWCRSVNMDYGVFVKSLGTLGSGNHFIEYDVNEELGKYAVVVHTGSRNLGQKVFHKWDSIANKAANGKEFKERMRSKVSAIKENWTGDKRKMKEAIEELKDKMRAEAMKNVGYLSGEDLKGYLHDMVIAQAYARYNHMTIHSIIGSIMHGLNGAVRAGEIFTTHNYIDFDDMMVRKGAIRSYEGEYMLIPFNMRDGIAVCEGKSNEDWNCSAPHGAGRLMSRNQAKKSLSLEAYKEQMKNAGIYSTSLSMGTLDEAPDAYKPMEEIIEQVKETCSIHYFLRPIMNIKGEE